MGKPEHRRTVRQAGNSQRRRADVSVSLLMLIVPPIQRFVMHHAAIQPILRP